MLALAARTLRTLALSALLATVAGAQTAEPRLPRDADPNDWEAYFDLGVRLLGRDSEAAEAAFTWSSKLRPDRAEPLFARWCAFFASDGRRFEQYLNGDEDTMHDAKVKRADSVRAAAFRRNPFVHQGLEIMAFNALPGRFRDDDITRAWLSLGKGDLAPALDWFGHLVQRDPDKFGYLRFVRASAFVNTARNDSARAELEALLAQLRARDEKVLGDGYESKELLEYALGLIHLHSGRPQAARAALETALVENPGFAPAHAVLGQMADAARDSARALQELALAVELQPDDAPYRMAYAAALVRARRPREAIAQLEQAVAIAPLYAEPYYLLAGALGPVGDAAGASERYGQFLQHDAQSDALRPAAERGILPRVPE
jgi:tetratricopeptide (TPR) repeat protein